MIQGRCPPPMELVQDSPPMTYTIEATAFYGGETGPFTLSLEVDGSSSGSCTNDLGRVSGTVARSGLWDGSCESVHYGDGRYARYYSFTLSGSASVTITLTSSAVDTWLALRSGSGTGSGLIEDDDDDGGGTDARITRRLAAGTYTIEATAFYGDETGPFTLSLEVDGSSSGSCTNDLGRVSGTVTRSGLWDGSCESVHYGDGRYARYYSFTLSGSASVTITLTSSAVDTWLALRSGSGTGGGLIEDDDDDGVGTDARITRTLTAGTYTIEATTFVEPVGGPDTGLFTLTLEAESATPVSTLPGVALALLGLLLWARGAAMGRLRRNAVGPLE